MIDPHGMNDANRALAGNLADVRMERAKESWAAARYPSLLTRLFRRLFRRA
jgi:hypothetical protein